MGSGRVNVVEEEVSVWLMTVTAPVVKKVVGEVGELPDGVRDHFIECAVGR
jgi:hypothetical protein